MPNQQENMQNQQNHVSMQGQYQTVNYHGATVSRELRDKIRSTSAADFVSFRPIPGEDNFVMQAKFPEKGVDRDGNTYDLRININYMLRGVARYIMDDNGNLDYQKAIRMNDMMMDFANQRDRGQMNNVFPQEIIDACDIPPERMEDFQRFVAANSTGDPRDLLGSMLDNNPFLYISEEVKHLLEYQHSLQTRMAQHTPEAIAGQQLLLKSYPDVRNIMASYRKMRDMDPVQETDLFHAMECTTLGAQYSTLLAKSREYQRVINHNDMSDVTFQVHKMKMPIRENTNEMAFGIHAYFTMSIENGDEPITISLETTAPPSDQMFFRPEPTRTGVGIFQSEAAVQAFHEEHNVLSAERVNAVSVSSKLKGEHLPLENPPEVFSLESLARDAYYADLNIQGLNPERQNEMTEPQKQTLRVVQGKYYEQILENERIALDSQKKKIMQMTSLYADADIDLTRQNTKATLMFLTGEKNGSYTKEAKSDPELRAIVDNVRKYAQMDVTAVHGNYEKERKLVNTLRKQVDAYMEKQDAKMLSVESDDESFRRRYLMAANLQNFLETQSNGLLFVPREGTAKAVYVDGVKHAPVTDDKFIDASDQPLFPHDPSPNDISQGYLGDCYLNAGLSALASRYPGKIRDSMVDNGNGTVTVRFFHRPINEETGKYGPTEPVYVTVDKKFPKENGSSDCLWVQMIERAYVASGLHLCAENPRPVPENIDDMYQQIKNGQKPMPTHEECPWLVDEYNQLHPWKPSYEEIESGRAGEFLNGFLGDEIYRNSREPGYIKIESPDAKKTFETSLVHFADDLIKITPVVFQDDRIDPALKEPKAEWDKANREQQFLSVLLQKKPGELAAMDSAAQQDMVMGFTSAVATCSSYLLNRARAKAAADGYENFDWNTVITDCKTVVRGVLDGTITEDSDFINKGNWGTFQALEQMFKTGMDQAIPSAEQAAVKERIFQTISKGLDEYAKQHTPSFRPYEGKYIPIENNIFEKIKSNLRDGNLVGCGTPGKSDKVCDNGLFDNHAYTVLGVSEHSMYEGGPKMKFIRLRNPHGRTGRQYDVNPKTKAVTPKKAEMKDTGGVFEVELHDFCTSFSYVDFNRLSLDMVLSDTLLSAEERQNREVFWRLNNDVPANRERANPAPQQPAPENPAPQQPAPENPAPQQPAPENPAPQQPAPENPAPQQPAPANPAPQQPAPANPAPQQPAPENPAPQQDRRTERMTYAKMGEMARPLREAMKNLKATNDKKDKNASDEYNAFFKEAELRLKQNFGGTMTGSTWERCTDGFKSLAEKGEAYLKHCAEHPRSGWRRETRMKEVSYMVNVCRAREQFKTPEEYIQDKLASEIGEFFRETQKAKIRAAIVKGNKDNPRARTDPEAQMQAMDTEEYKQTWKEIVKKDVTFRRLVEQTDLRKLNDLTLSRKQAMAQMDKVKKAMAKEAAAAPSRANAPQAAQPNARPNAQPRQEPRKQGPSRSL